MEQSSINEVKTLGSEQILAGGGEMGARIRAFDWSQTPVGPVATWPHSLKTAVQILLNSRFPMFVWWGPAMTNFYNDAYAPILGQRHPTALGRSAFEVWTDVWPVVGPQAEVVMREGRATWNESILLVMERYGYPEEAYFTFSYSPAPDDTGDIGGVFCAVTEDTGRVLGERRLKTLRDLGQRTLAEAETAKHACHAAAVTFAQNPYDFPFTLIYLLNENAKQAYLCETVNLSTGTKASPITIAIDSGDDVWNFGRVIETNQSQIIENLEARFGQLPAGLWTDDWPKQAIVLPIAKSKTQDFPAGFLVNGISPRLAFNDDYRSFLELAAGQLATAIANARAYEEERQRVERLAELDRAKTAFFSSVSHEFRTPLTLMLGPLEDLLRQVNETLPPEQREQIEVAHRNSLRLLKLVNTLLDFSRIEAERLRAAYEPTDLVAYTAELASVFRSAIERAELRLVVSSTPLTEPVYIDREMWEKIVLNLLSNAFKFTFSGEIEVSLRQVGESVELVVRDTGIGIPAEEIPHLFERFYRVKGASGRTLEGSGIGLALVQELVKLHGGTVRAESQVGSGSRFIVSLPLGRAHLPTDQIGPARPSASTGLPGEAYLAEALRWLPTLDNKRTESDDLSSPLSPASPTHILLADDNADMRGYIQRLLEQHGYEVEAVADGQAALRAAHEYPPDLVLTDVMMPRLDGFGLLKALRADEHLKMIPVIILSARAGEESRVEGIEAGADDYLIKPFSARELLAYVKANLELSHVRRQIVERESQLREETERIKERLARILAGIQDDFVMYDNDWRYVYVNDRAAQSLGYPKEQLLGQRIWDLFPEAIGNLFYREMLRAKAAGREVAFEHYYEPWGKWIENRAYPLPEGMLLFATDITDRKRVEEVLRQSEERFRQLAEAMPHFVWIVELDRSISYINQQWLEFSGLTLEQTNDNELLSEIFHPDDRQRIFAAWQEAFVSVTPYEMEARMRNRHGQYHWFLIRTVAIKDADGKVLKWFGTSTDITEHKRAEAVLQRQSKLIELSFEPILVWDLNGIIIEWNAGAEKLYGFTRSEAIGQVSHKLLKTVHQFPLDEFLRLLERTQEWTGELQHTTKDGRTVIVESRHQFLEIDGRWLILEANRDISERKHTEHRLAEQARLLDLTNDTIFARDMNNDITYWNRGAVECYGYTAEEALGQMAHDLLQTGFPEPRERILEKLHRDGYWSGELIHTRKDGSKLTVMSRWALDRDAQGNPVSILETNNDITEHKRAEMAERLLAEMRERNRVAQELHDTVAQALGYLNLKIGLTHTLLESNQGELVKANFKELRQVISETYTDVREEIFYLRAKALSDLSFMELLERYIDKYRRFYNLDIQLIREADPSLFNFPPETTSQLVRTIQEALINIRKHARVNTAIIRLSQENGQLCIRIEDQGQGFDLNAASEKTSSFGLQIMRERVESVGGSLEIETAPSQGTQVVLRYHR